MNPYWIIAGLAAVPFQLFSIPLGDLGPWALVGTGLVQFVLFVRWLYRRMRDDEIQRAFIRDLALNHLPHVYSALRQIAEHQGIALEDPPLIRYVEINGRRANS